MTAEEKRAIEEETVRRCQAWLRQRADGWRKYEGDPDRGREYAEVIDDEAAALSLEVLPGSEVIA